MVLFDFECSIVRGDEWSLKIFKCPQNFTFARLTLKGLNECLLAHAYKLRRFAIARMLVFLSVCIARNFVNTSLGQNECTNSVWRLTPTNMLSSGNEGDK